MKRCMLAVLFVLGVLGSYAHAGDPASVRFDPDMQFVIDESGPVAASLPDVARAGVTAQVLTDVNAPLTDPDVVASRLAALKPLKKPHYSWSMLGFEFKHPGHPILYQYVRVTRSASLYLGHTDRGDAAKVFKDTVKLCADVNALDPASDVPATVAFIHMPWHHYYLPDENGDFPGLTDATDWGPTYEQELSEMVRRLNRAVELIVQANTELGTDVRVSAILLDCERFNVDYPKDANGNPPVGQREAIVRKLTETYDACKSAFPSAEVHWFCQGTRSATNNRDWRNAVPWGNPKTAWRDAGIPVEIPGDSWSCAFYWPEDPFRNETIFMHTVGRAQEQNLHRPMTVWATFGAGYQYRADGSAWFSHQAQYDPELTRALSREVNGTQFPFDQITFVCIYPEPERSIYFWNQFIPWVEAAQNLN